MFSVMDVAKRYKVSRDTVQSWILGGLLSATDVGPAGSKRKYYRVSEESLAEFERTRNSGCKAPPRTNVPAPAKKYV